jgi:hypothetical protein
MAATTFGVAWIWLALAGGAGVLPAMGAPLPLDPNLSTIAPEECLWYVASSGMGAAQADSSNHTEQLFAEPQVQRLFTEIETQVMAAVRRAGGPNREQRVLATEIPKVVKALISRPLAAFVGDVRPGPDETVQAEAAFVLSAGEGRAELEGALNQLLALARENQFATTSETIADVEWQRVTLPPQAPPVRFGWKGDYFLIAIGEETPAALVERIDGAVDAVEEGSGAGPAWLQEIRSEHPIEREMSIGYLNVAGIRERVQPIVESHHPGAWPIVEQLGITSIKTLHGVSGYDAVGCMSTAHVVTDGEQPGSLGFLPHEPLAEGDLAIVPKDALVAAAVRISALEVMEKAVALASQFEPRAGEEFEEGLWEAERHLGVDVRADVVAALDDVWVAYLPAGDLMFSWLNSAAAIKVKDADKLRTSVRKIVDAAKAEMARHNERVSIGETTIDGQTLYSLQFEGEPVPFSPSWCVSDQWVVFGLLPEAVRSALDRDAEDSLATSEAVREAREADAPSTIFYQDTPQLVRSVYPFVQMGVQMLSAQLRQAGISIDTTALPSPETVIKHLRPSVSTVSHSDDGFHFTQRGTLPGGGNVVGAMPVVVGLALPAVQSARSAARQAQEMNNLKQLALAFHNYADANRAFPTDVYSADGSPLLSWRVRLLPYMEEASLYSQFKLEEPWDSENNRPLLDQMPAVFRSPDSEYLFNRTRYVTLDGENTLFPGNEKLSFRDVTDGTSNTIMFVQVHPDAAVEWTRPADVDFNPERPFANVAQQRGEFLAAYCDGSVHRLSLGIGKEVMTALATRNGEEVISYEETNQPAAPWLYGEYHAVEWSPAETPAESSAP